MRLSLIAFTSVILMSCGGGSGGNSPSPVAVVNPPTSNSAPQVNAGLDQNVTASAEVNLAATAIDNDGDEMQFSWVQIAGPLVTISNSTQMTANFVAPSVNTTEVLLFEFTATDDQNASSADDVQITVNPLPPSGSCPSAVPDSLRSAPFMLDFFYQKYCDAEGLPVLGSSVVRNEAFRIARARATEMTRNLEPAVKQAIIDLNTRIAIIAQSEVTTDIPEHSDLNTVFPETDWDNRTRGVGATPERPATSAGEENLLCLPDDIFSGEDIFVHEYAHTVHIMGLRVADPTFDSDLSAAYDAAIEQGLWGKYLCGHKFVRILGRGRAKLV